MRLALTLLLAALAAWTCEWLRVPLPWLIGPLALTAAGCMLGWPLVGSVPLRNFGQGVIGIALGLYFTPGVVALMPSLAPALLAGIAWALLMGYVFYRFLRSLGGADVDAASAFFAAAIGGASEMSLLAERHGGKVDRVAAAHSLRVLLVVVLIPVGVQLSGAHGADAALPAVQAVRPLGLLALAAASAVGVMAMRRLGLPNPWVLGSLLVTIVVTVSDLQLSAMPRPLSNAAQLFVGVALGTRFTPDFVRAAPRWLIAVAIGTLAMIAASGLFAWGLARLMRLHPATVLLGTSPGGIAEMCITAKVLQLGVPTVTALHVVRYVAVLTLTAPLYRWERGRETARAS